jgi:hypothetical protein
MSKQHAIDLELSKHPDSIKQWTQFVQTHEDFRPTFQEH